MPPRPRLARAAVTAAALLAGAHLGPRLALGRSAGALFAGERGAAQALADAVAEDARRPPSAADFRTGSARFDGEWALVTHQMTALGLGQVALAHPALRARYLPAIEASVERLLAPATTRFGAEAWGAPGLGDPVLDHGHAYLGYAALALGMLRRLDPGTRFAREHDRLVEGLARRLAAAPHGLVETYPGEAYPADVAACVGAIGLHAQATGRDRGESLRRWSALARARWIEPRSGLLHQNGDARSGRPTGPPRASGTAIAAYFLSFADPALARDLAAAIARQRESLLGLGAVREHPPGTSGGGDIDSGPVLLGVSVSATGFGLASARLVGDRGMFVEIARTAELFGMPVPRSGATRFATGGPLGDALLLAMMTVQP